MVLMVPMPPLEPGTAFAACQDRPGTALLESGTETGGGRFSVLAVVLKADAAGMTMGRLAFEG